MPRPRRVQCFALACAPTRPFRRGDAHRHPVCSLPDRSIGAFAYECKVPDHVRSSHYPSCAFHFRCLVVNVNYLAPEKAKGPASHCLDRRACLRGKRIRLAISSAGEGRGSNFHAAIVTQREGARRHGDAAGEPIADPPRRVRADARWPTPRGCRLILRRLRHTQLSAARRLARTRAKTPAWLPRAEAAGLGKELRPSLGIRNAAV